MWGFALAWIHPFVCRNANTKRLSDGLTARKPSFFCFDPRVLGAIVGRKLFGDLHLVIPLHVLQCFATGRA